jgi:hypothetical protein
MEGVYKQPTQRLRQIPHLPHRPLANPPVVTTVSQAQPLLVVSTAAYRRARLVAQVLDGLAYPLAHITG